MLASHNVTHGIRMAPGRISITHTVHLDCPDSIAELDRDRESGF
jgi:hypothetical protein